MSIHAYLRYVLPLLSLALLATTACTSTPPEEPRLRAADVWARPAMAPMAMGGGQAASVNGAVYLTLYNDGDVPDRLVGVTTDVARVAEIHETVMQPTGAMGMQPVAGVDLPAHGSVAFKPGGLHVMLIDLRQGLQPGDRFSIELRFERSPALMVPVTVREP